MTIDPVKGVYGDRRAIEILDLIIKSLTYSLGGNASLQEGDSTFTFNVLSLIQTKMPKELTDQIDKMAIEAGGADADINSDFVKKAFASIQPDNKTASKALNKLNSSKKFASGNDAEGLMAFSVDGLRYVPRERALFSRSTIDLFQVGDHTINAQFNCMYEIVKKRSGDGFSAVY